MGGSGRQFSWLGRCTSGAVNHPDHPFDQPQLELPGCQTDDPPSVQHGLKVLARICRIPTAPVVPSSAAQVDPSLDLDECPAGGMCEIRTPFPHRMKAEFPLQRRALRDAPEKEEEVFELRCCHGAGGTWSTLGRHRYVGSAGDGFHSNWTRVRKTRRKALAINRFLQLLPCLNPAAVSTSARPGTVCGLLPVENPLTHSSSAGDGWHIRRQFRFQMPSAAV